MTLHFTAICMQVLSWYGRSAGTSSMHGQKMSGWWSCIVGTWFGVRRTESCFCFILFDLFSIHMLPRLCFFFHPKNPKQLVICIPSHFMHPRYSKWLSRQSSSVRIFNTSKFTQVLPCDWTKETKWCVKQNDVAFCC